MKKRFYVVLLSLILTISLVGVSFADDGSLVSGATDESDKIPTATVSSEPELLGDTSLENADADEESAESTAEPTIEPTVEPTAEPTPVPTATPDLTDPYIVQVHHDIELYERNDDTGALTAIGIFSPNDENDKIGTFIENGKLDGMDLFAETIEETESSNQTVDGCLKLDKTKTSIGELMFQWDKNLQTYVALTLGDRQCFAKINDVGNIVELMKTYTEECEKKSVETQVEAATVKAEAEKEKAVAAAKASQKKGTLVSIIALVEGGIIGIATLLMAALKFLDSGNQDIAKTIKLEMQETRQQVKQGSDSVSKEISDLQAAVLRMPEAIIGGKSKSGSKPEPVDYVKVFLRTANTLTKTSDPDWQKILAEYNPILVSYDEISGRFYEASSESEPSYAVCSINGNKYVVPSCYDKKIKNVHFPKFFALIASPSGTVTGYKVDKPAKVEQEGAYFNISERGQITLLDN